MKTFTFENGVTAQIKRVAPLLLNQLKRSFAPPAPPIQMIDMGDGKQHAQSNPAHPDHIAAMHGYHEELGIRLIELLIARGVEVDIDQAAVDQLRAEMGAIGVRLPADDKIVYIAHICVQSQDELEQLRGAIMGASVPTEAAIKEEVDSFRS